MGTLGLIQNLAYPAPMGDRAPDRAGMEPRDADSADVDRFLRGEEDAFESLVIRHETEVFRIGMRLLDDREDAQEAAQEVFLRVYRGLPSFRGEASFRTWLVGIAINVCRNHLSSAVRKNRDRQVPLESRPDPEGDPVEMPLPSSDPDPEAALYGKELGAVLGGALSRLSGEHREILLLREVLSMEYEEISAALGCAVGTVKSRLARARDALRENLRGVWP
jgi:RNA polymerase sigma-70 factor, ECF subfamily